LAMISSLFNLKISPRRCGIGTIKSDLGNERLQRLQQGIRRRITSFSPEALFMVSGDNNYQSNWYTFV
ncbi:hypothetical protein, partial [Vibrio anguillarum]